MEVTTGIHCYTLMTVWASVRVRATVVEASSNGAFQSKRNAIRDRSVLEETCTSIGRFCKTPRDPHQNLPERCGTTGTEKCDEKSCNIHSVTEYLHIVNARVTLAQHVRVKDVNEKVEVAVSFQHEQNKRK